MGEDLRRDRESWRRELGGEVESLARAITVAIKKEGGRALRPVELAAALGLTVVRTDGRLPTLLPETLAIPRSMSPRGAGEAISVLATRSLLLELSERLARAILLPAEEVRRDPRLEALRAAFPEVTERQLRARLRELGLPLPTLRGPGPGGS